MDKQHAKHRRAINKYSIHTCMTAFRLHTHGEGARTVGILLGLTTNQADAAINAGRALARVSAQAQIDLCIDTVRERDDAERSAFLRGRG